MNLENALKITEGWCEQNDLEYLARHASQSKRIVEVGSWHGRSTTCLADNTDGIVFAVDTWGGSEEHHGVLPQMDKPAYREFCDRVYGSFCSNMKSYIDSGKVIPVHLPSVEAARLFTALNCGTFDMVFIDAAHDYENVKADLLAWRPLVRGLFCGHDAGHGPVMQALAEILPNRLPNDGSMWQVTL